MNDAQFGSKIATLLDDGLDRVDGEVATRLQLARKAALAQAASQHHAGRRDAPKTVDAGRGWRAWLSGSRVWIATAAIVLAVSGMLLSSPASVPEQTAAAELDVGILTDELPVSAYIEDGFDAWLKRPVDSQP